MTWAPPLRDKDAKRLDLSSRKAAAAGEVCQQVTDYLAELFATGLLNEDQVTRTANLMSAINDIERIGQLCGDVAQIARRSDFSDKASEDLRDAMFLAEEMFAGAMRSMASGDSDEARRVNEGNSRMIEIEMHMRKGHMKRVAKQGVLTEPHEGVQPCAFRYRAHRRKLSQHCRGIPRYDEPRLLPVRRFRRASFDEVGRVCVQSRPALSERAPHRRGGALFCHEQRMRMCAERSMSIR